MPENCHHYVSLIITKHGTHVEDSMQKTSYHSHVHPDRNKCQQFVMPQTETPATILTLSVPHTVPHMTINSGYFQCPS